jgi:hypothetical protein
MSVALDHGAASPGAPKLRPAPAGMPGTDFTPPAVAETGDPFTTIRVVDYLARLERGRRTRIDDMVDGLNARYLDWLFPRQVVVDTLVALQANWMADYRNVAGFELEDGEYGATVLIEDTTRVDPWIVNQAQRQAAACREALREFARRDRVASDG